MATKNDDTNTVTASASLRSVVLIAVCSALGSGAIPSCSTRGQQAEILERLDRIERAHERDYTRLDNRLARIEQGARGAGNGP